MDANDAVVLTRDDAYEGTGKLRVEWRGGISGILVGYEVSRDVVTIGVDFPSVARLEAPRTECRRISNP